MSVCCDEKEKGYTRILMIIRDKLFSAIRSGLEQEISDLEISAIDCGELLEISVKQSIMPIVYRGLKRMGVPAEYLEQFNSAWFKHVFRFGQRHDALGKLSTALNNRKIPYVPLKGAVLQYLYPDPNMRTSSDIDILVHEEDIDQAVQAIEDHTAFVFVKRNYHDVLMTNSRVALELHFSIKENMENIDKLLSKAWEYAQLTDDGFRYEFTPEYLLFHVVAHMSYHMVHGGLGIRPFLDLWLLRNKSEYNEAEVRRMFADCGILTFYEKCCELVDSWMSGKQVSDELSLLEEYCLSGGVFGSDESVSASRMRKHQKSNYLMNRLFVRRDVLEAVYPELRDKPLSMPFYQMKRWTRLLDKNRLSGAIKELDGVRNVSEEAVNSFDELLKGLGLD